ncbi:MAG: hypothetical protein IPN94_22570 [Sphingobacteriales bacterium]|nr:hypothetical protein [Sphingobacteriales bacterium]
MLPNIKFLQTNPSVLAQIMIKDNEVYKKLIKNNWNEITKRLPNDFQPEQFYEQIVSYFNKSKDDSSPIASLNIVCTNNKTFVNKNTQAFFSSQLAKVSNYNLLSNVIAQLISLATPHKSIINYLTSPPFNVSESKVSQRSINQSQLFDAEDLKALINFMKTNSEDFWQHYYLQQIADDEIQVHEKTANVVFYYTTNAPLLQFIANHSASLRKKFVLLPNGFTTYIAHNRHVFQQENLETLLLENIAINQHQEELISVINYTNAQTKLLLAINNITVDTNQLTQYTTDHFVYQVLALAIKHTNNEAVVSHIRKQIILTTGTLTITLADVPSTDTTVQLYTNTESYSLDLAKILPVSYQNNAILAIFVAHFVKLGLDKQAFEQLLGKEKEKAIDETVNIYNLLKKELSNQAQILTLQNAEQLAFVLLANISDKLPLSPFCVETLGGLVKLQSNSFYIKTFSFIDVTATLSGTYNGLDKKLKINRHNSIFKTSEANVLLEPYFVNNTFNAPLIAIDTETQQIDLLTFLYQKWANNPDVQNLLPQLYWAAGGAFDTEKYLNFNPYCCVDNDAVFDATEQLPEYIANWRNKDTAQNKFLYQLGVHAPNGVLHQLRNYFNNKNLNLNALQTAFQQKKINQQLIANTLLYWQQQKVLVNTTEALSLIGYLYSCLPMNEYLGVVPMLYIQRITKEDAAFEYVFKDNCATDFLFDKQITEHLHQEGIYLAELLPIIKEQENSELLNQDAYPTNWQSLRSRKINITPATVNYAQLLADSTGEWINDGYKNWRESLKNKYRVYCYKRQIPAYLYLITDENNGGYSIKTRLLGDMVIDETTGNIFVNEAALSNFKDLLNSFLNKGITFDDYVEYLEAMTTKTPLPKHT